MKRSVFLSICTGCCVFGFVAGAALADTCPGHVEKLLTPGHQYIGSMEEWTSDVEDPGHAADAELLSVRAIPVIPPTREKFAIAWISNSEDVWIRRYDVATGSLLGVAKRLNNPNAAWEKATRHWVRSLGFDFFGCPAIQGENWCAWFAWANEWGLVYWRAIGAETGKLSQTFWGIGRDPSGALGVAQASGWPPVVSRKRLVAYISLDRKQVWTAFLDPSGYPVGPYRLLRTITEPNWKASQTAVVWSGRERRWLVSWTENYDLVSKFNGKIMVRTVEFDGTVGPVTDPDLQLMYCEGDPQQQGCLGKAVFYNPRCVCKGIWLSSSPNASFKDRFRLHQYGKQASLDGSGALSALWSSGMPGTFAPLTQAALWSDGQWTPYQILESGHGSGALHSRLVQESAVRIPAGPVFNTLSTPQGFKAGASVAVALAEKCDGDPPQCDLGLSIVDVTPNGCKKVTEP
ncbi:MAG: hypothetical protein JSV80_18270 [Acidobacteriota bacterium]|nr:MAG: hypothetical protein JSV80_18270 [Acidobacteriota bacterium]